MASQYEASTGTASRTCSAAAPFMIAPERVSICHVPWPGVMTTAVPPETHHRALERSERTQRRIQEQQAEHLARQRLRLRYLLQARGEAQQVLHLLARGNRPGRENDS